MPQASFLRAFRFRVSLMVDNSGQDTPVKDAQKSSSLPKKLCDGGFQEVSGLEISMDVKEYLPGGTHLIHQSVGHAKYVPLVLKRGMFYTDQGKLNANLWRWMQGVIGGAAYPLIRCNGTVEIIDMKVGASQPAGQQAQKEVEPKALATWAFRRGLPAKVVGPSLNAKTGEIAIEEIHIAHQGLELLLT